MKVAECEHQFKVVDELQKILVVREMMPKDIKREFFTGPRKFDEIMEKLEIIINEMMTDDGPVPMDLGNVVSHDTKMKGFKGPGGEHIKNYGQQVMSVRTAEGYLYARVRGRWQTSEGHWCQLPSKPEATCSLGKMRRTS